MNDEKDEIGDEVEQTGTEDQDQKSAPIFNLPSTIVGFVAVLLVIHAFRSFWISPAFDETILTDWAFVPARFLDLVELGDYWWLLTLVTYSLLHENWQHVIFNCIWMVVFGAPVAARLGTARSLVFFVFASVFAALGFMAVHYNEVIFVLGASGVVSGLTGAACRFAFAGGMSPEGRSSASGLPQLSIRQALSNRSTLWFMGFWFVANVVTGAGAILLGISDSPVAWEAHIAGFLFGFLFFPLFDPTPEGVLAEEA